MWCVFSIPAVALSIFAASLQAADFFVAPPPLGSDAQSGSQAAPFATIQHAARQAFAGDTVHIMAGTYREEVDFPRSGQPGNPITFRAWENPSGVVEEAIVSGFDLVEENSGGSGSWQMHSPGIWKIQLASGRGLTIGNNLILRNGAPGTKARWPNADRAFDFDYRNMASADAATLAAGPGGAQPPWAGNNFHTATYTDPDIPAGNWTGALIDLSTGAGAHRTTGAVTSFNAGVIEFRYPLGPSDPVAEADPYFLWNSLDALDAEGEFFYDVEGSAGSPHTLYLYSDASPALSGDTFELRERGWTLGFGQVSDIVIKDLILEGAGVECRSLSRDIELDGLEIRYAGFGLNELVGARVGVSFKGVGHRLRNSRVHHSFGGGVLATGTSIEVEENVIGDCFLYAVATFGGHDVTVRRNTTYRTGGFNIAMFATASRYLYNHCYLAGLRTTDEAIINTNYNGDGQNSEVAWNWAHTNVARRDLSRNWGGGKGIRLDSGSFGVSNYFLHHNVIWNTTGPQGLVLWSLESGQLNSGNSMIRAYHNTVAGDIVFAGQGSIGGHDIRNNLARDIAFRGASTAGSNVSSNVLYGPTDIADWPGNTEERRLFTAAPSGDFRLEPGSPVIDSAVPIPAINDVYSGAAPDPGALEFQAGGGVGQACGFRPGARLQARHLDGLAPDFVADPAGGTILEITGFPEGRMAGEGFRVRLDGTTVLDEHSVKYEIANHQATIRFHSLPSLPAGPVTVEFSTDGGLTFPVLQTADSPTLAMLSLDPLAQVSSPLEGGVPIQLQGTGFRSGTLSVPVEFEHILPEDLNHHPVPMVIDTSAWVASGKLPPSGAARLQIVHTASGSVLDYAIESGYGTASTLVWVKFPENLLDQGFQRCGTMALSFEIPGDGVFAKAPDPTLLESRYPILADPRMLLWLSANRLSGQVANQAPVSEWLDSSPLQNHAMAPNSGTPPVFQAGSLAGLGTVRFDGAQDHLLAGALTSSPPGELSLIVVHRNETGGDPQGRLFSSGPGSGNEQVHASAGSTTNEWIFKTTRRNGGSLEHFTLGKKTRRTSRYFKGELAEMFFFDGRLETGDFGDWNVLQEYVSRKYQLDFEARGSLGTGSGTAPMQVSVEAVGEVPFTLVHGGLIELVTPALPSGLTTPAALDIMVTANGQSRVLENAILYTSGADSELWLGEFGLMGDSFDWSDDPEADSLSLLEEYAYDLDPENGDAAESPQVVERSGFAGLGFEFRQNLQAGDLEIFVQSSPDLVTWTETALSALQVDVIEADPDGDGSAQLVRVGLNQAGIGNAPPAEDPIFVRLRLELRAGVAGP